jgi:Family of unknown function (DUF5519)
MKERTMTNQALSTLPRRAKGPIAPPPALTGKLKAVADAVAAWPDVEATTHWRFDQPNRVDGVDFYVGSDELGHIHLDGSIHLATTPRLGAELVAEGVGQPFVWARGWTTASIHGLGVDRSVALFRRNYDRLRSPTE